MKRKISYFVMTMAAILVAALFSGVIENRIVALGLFALCPAIVLIACYLNE